VDTTNPQNIEDAIQPNTKVLLLESPSNPLLKITDLEAMVAIARKRKLITVIDNTFLTPYYLQPIALGIDVCVHSATKFLGGHSDLIAGAVMTRTAQLGKAVKFVQNTCGNILSPNDSWLLMRGIKTLSARMDIQSECAITLARWLCSQSWVTEVFYPGLESHPGYYIITKQASGYGAVVSVKIDTVERVLKMMKNVKLWNVAVSLGGVESILSYPRKMSHAAIPQEERHALGISDNLIRLSIGLEEVQDLIHDLQTAAN
jgi:cystathionine beta-lyase/cystathionine gamma-synthase